MAPISRISTPTSTVDQAWLFTSEEVKNPPSVQAGMSREEELHTRAIAVRRLFQYKEVMNVQQIVVSSASVFIHRFYMRRSMQMYPWVWVSAAAFFLASKTEEHSRRANDIIAATLCLERNQIPRLNNNRVVYNDKDIEHQEGLSKLKKMEEAIMNAGCFDFTIRQPYWELIKGCKIVWRDTDLKMSNTKGSKATRIARCGWLFINDSLTTPLCLVCRPNVIAATALILACVQMEENLPPTPTEIALEASNDEGAEEGEEPEKMEYWLDLFDVSPDEIGMALKYMRMGGYFRASDPYIVAESGRTFAEAKDALSKFPIPASQIATPTTLTLDPKPITTAPAVEEVSMEDSPTVEEKPTIEETNTKAAVDEGIDKHIVSGLTPADMGMLGKQEVKEEDVTMSDEVTKKEPTLIPLNPPQLDHSHNDSQPSLETFFANNKTPEPGSVDVTISDPV